MTPYRPWQKPVVGRCKTVFYETSAHTLSPTREAVAPLLTLSDVNQSPARRLYCAVNSLLQPAKKGFVLPDLLEKELQHVPA